MYYFMNVQDELYEFSVPSPCTESRTPEMNYFLILKPNIFCKLDKCILQIEHKHILQHGQSQQRPDGKKIQNKEQVAPSVTVSDLRSILRAGQEKITTVKF